MSLRLRRVVLLCAIGVGVLSVLGCSSHEGFAKDAGVRARARRRDPRPEPKPSENAGDAATPDSGVVVIAADGGTTEIDLDGGGASDASLHVGPDDRPVADAGADSADASIDLPDSGSDSGIISMPPAPGPGTVISEPKDAATYVFDQDVIRTYNLVIAEADLALIDASPADEVYVRGMLEFEGKTYGPLGVRYKGSVGSFLAPCTGAASAGMKPGAKTGKCSIKVDFDRMDPDARFYGLKKLNFHAMGRDKSMLRDRLGYTLFREFGVVAPRAMHVRLSINGQLEGLYIAVEQIDGRFTHSRFTDGGDGNLYKEVWPTSDTPQPYLTALETNQDDNPSVDKMLRFKAAIDQGAEAAMQWLDSKYVFNYVAADRVMINDDGAFHWYCAKNHNFYWYESERADRMWLIPWDMDSSFQGGSAFVHIAAPWNAPATMCTCVAGQRPASCDRLTSAWVTFTNEYEESVDAFLAGPFAATNIDPKLATWSAQIDSLVMEAAGLNGAPTYDEWRMAYATLQSVIATSRTHRGYPYDAEPLPMSTDPNGAIESLPVSIP